MAVKTITFVYKLEVPNIATIEENATAYLFELLPLAEEKVATRDITIAMEKTGLEDTGALPKKDDIEKAKITGDSPLKQDPDEMAIVATPQKVSNRDAEMAAREDSTEMQVDSISKEDSQEKAKYTTEQDFKLFVTNALEKININSYA